MRRFLHRWHRFSLLFIVGLLLCCAINLLPRQALPVVAQSPPQEQLVQQGIQQYEAGKFTQAIQVWQQALPAAANAQEKAVIYSNLALAYRQIGQLDKAIANWEQGIQIYQQQNDATSQAQLAGLLIEQGQAYNDLGQHERAAKLLQSAVAIASKYQLPQVEAAGRGALGNAYWAIGDYEQAKLAHEASLKTARELNNQKLMTTAGSDLGNVYTSWAERYRYQAASAAVEGDDPEAKRLTQLAEQNTAAAQAAYEQSVESSQVVGGLAEVTARGNLIRHLERLPAPNRDLIASNRQRSLAVLAGEPDSQDKAYALINLATHREQTLLEQALTVARNIEDSRALSFALGKLGEMYEGSRQYERAMELTRQAQFAAQQINAADSLYRWQWQAGRILNQMGDKQRAIAAYKQAIASLQTIRGDIVAANRELQFNFRDEVEPVYRELIGLLLEPIETEVSFTKAAPRTENIKEVLDILELLKLAELQNFFGDECVQVAQNVARSDGGIVDPTAAVIYSIVLDNRTEMILRLPGDRVTSYRVPLGQAQMQQEIDQLRSLLEKRATEEYIPQAQKIYQLLISPQLEADLAAAKPSTVVFINDGMLRQVPMAALNDGKQFLIQKYAIATAPSLSLTASKPLDRSRLKALALGLTVARPPFAPLTNVNDEVTNVQALMGGTRLLDGEFTLNRLQEQLQKQSYPIVHIATHGKFGVDANSSFLLAFDSRISIEQVDQLLRQQESQQSVELLTLSACQTAAGNNRAALGIAGVAVRAGVKSALASLWFINDEATVPLIKEFYTQLRQPDITKAEALRRAQLKMIADQNYNHPAVWSPFILIGNWL